MKKYENFVSALANLEDAPNQDLNNDFVQSGLINKFNLINLIKKIQKNYKPYKNQKNSNSSNIVCFIPQIVQVVLPSSNFDCTK